MQDIEREHVPTKSGKMPFDESKLTPAQREAVAIAKDQGKDLSLTINDLKGNMDSKAVAELMDAVMDMRRRPAKVRSL